MGSDSSPHHLLCLRLLSRVGDPTLENILVLLIEPKNITVAVVFWYLSSPRHVGLVVVIQDTTTIIAEGSCRTNIIMPERRQILNFVIDGLLSSILVSSAAIDATVPIIITVINACLFLLNPSLLCYLIHDYREGMIIYFYKCDINNF